MNSNSWSVANQAAADRTRVGVQRGRVECLQPGLSTFQGSWLARSPGPSGSPADRALLRRIDFLHVLSVEKSFRLFRQELLGVGITKVESVMVDQHRLVLKPFRPAGLAYFGMDPLSELVSKGSVWKRVPFFLAAGALNDGHFRSPILFGCGRVGSSGMIPARASDVQGVKSVAVRGVRRGIGAYGCARWNRRAREAVQ